MNPPRRLRWRPAFDVAIPGVYAWVVTVAVPIRQKEADGWPLAFSWLAVMCLVATTLGVTLSRFRSWSAIPVALFIMSSASVWFLIAPFDASLGFLGSLGWASFAVGWVRAAETSCDTDGRAAHRIDLLPRHRVSVLASLLVGLGLLGALSLVLLAWRIDGRERSLLAHAVAVMGALSLLTAASSSAAVLGRQAAARAFSKGQLGRTVSLVALLAFGCWLTLFRS